MKPNFYQFLRKLVFLLSLLFCNYFFVNAQQYLTKIDGWNAYVHLPDEYNDSIQKNYPLICFIPGLGEVGTDASKMLIHGPSKFVAEGHNMQFMVNGKLEKPIVISLQPSAAWPGAYLINKKLDSLFARFRIDQQRVNVTGLSMGGWSWNNYVDGYSPAYTNRITSIVALSALEPDNTISNMRHFAIAGGKIWGFEGNQDLRGMDKIRDTMNKYVPASVRYTVYNGGHCCWNTFYNPTWIENGESIYTWMLKQKKPALANPIPPQANAGSDELLPAVIPSITLDGIGNDPVGLPISFNWKKLSGPAAGTIASVSSSRTNVNNLAFGTYAFEFKVTNSLGLVGLDTIFIYNGERVLPVNLTEFNAQKSTDGVLLNWITATELNTKQFEIERSNEGILFTQLAVVEATNETLAKYNFTDINPNEGVNFYRLKMIDKDDSYEYSKIININYQDKRFGRINIDRAAATTNQIQLQVTSDRTEIVTLNVTNVLGHTVFQKRVQLHAGNNNVVQPFASPKAILFCRIVTESDRSNAKTIVIP